MYGICCTRHADLQPLKTMMLMCVGRSDDDDDDDDGDGARHDCKMIPNRFLMTWSTAP